MLVLLVLLGAIITGMGAVCLLKPDTLKRVVEVFWQRPDALYLAVGFRLVSGAILVAAAPRSHYPTVIGLLGVLFLLTAAFIPLVGRHRLNALVEWWAAQPDIVVRLWSVAALALGGFILCAAVQA